MEVVLVKTEAESPEWEGLVSLPELEEDPLDIERWLTEHQLASQDDGSHDDRALLFGNNADLISDFIKTEYQFDTEEEYVSWSQLVLNGEVGEYQTEGYGVAAPLVEVKLPVEEEVAIPADKEANSTVELLKEFEAVLQDQVLTPPHSPNQNSSLYHFYPTNQEFELEELVISRVEECTRGELNSGEGSTVVGSGGCSPSSSLYSSTEGDLDEDKTDPSWSPSPASPQSSPQPEEDEDEEEVPTKRRKRTLRSAPYTKSSPDERKLRKKEQNKNAATKYRQKKKQETEKILDEEKGLKTHNEDLKGKLSDLQREIKYLKSLMREVFKAKGLIK